MIKLKNSKIALIVFLLFPNFAFAEDEITLQQAVEATYENNLELKSRKYSLEAAKSQKLKAYSGFLPKVAMDVNSGTQKSEIGGDAERKGRADKRDLNVAQPLFNGGNTYFDIQRAENVISKEKLTNDAKEQEIFFEVIQAYFQILQYQETLQIEEENFASQEKLLEYTRKKRTAKDATKSDLAKVEADYAAASNSTEIARNNLSSAKVIFTRLTGITVDEGTVIKKINHRFSYKKMSQFKEEDFYEIALKANPELNATKHSAEAAKHESSMAQSSLSPSVNFTYDSSNQKNSIYFANRRQKNETLYLNLHIPFFSSGVEYAQISNANNLWRSEKYNFEAVRVRLKQQIHEYLVKVKNTCFAYESAKEQESANTIYVETIKLEEKLGTRSIVDLLVARRELYQAKKTRVESYYEEILAIFMLKSLIGDLTYGSLNQEDILSDFETKHDKSFVQDSENNAPIIHGPLYKKAPEVKNNEITTSTESLETKALNELIAQKITENKIADKSIKSPPVKKVVMKLKAPEEEKTEEVKKSNSLISDNYHQSQKNSAEEYLKSITPNAAPKVPTVAKKVYKFAPAN